MMSYINETDFVIENKKLVYPEIVTDGLQLYYDAKGKRDTDYHRDTMLDMSGNKNHGKLHNFAYEKHSGYKDGLVFDYIDDKLVRPTLNLKPDDFTFMLNGNIISFSPDGTVKRVQDGEVIESKGFNMLYDMENTRYYSLDVKYNYNHAKARWIDSSNNNTFLYSTTKYSYKDKHKYYISYNAKPDGDVRLRIYANERYLDGDVFNPIINEYNFRSGILEADSQYGNQFNVRLLFNSASAIGIEVDIKDLMMIDLTETFGAGNEPTKEQMDEIIDRFGFIPNAQDLIDRVEYKGNDLGDMENIIDGLYKTDILSGEEIYTDKADDAVVHVEVDGNSVGGGSGKNLVELDLLEQQSVLRVKYPLGKLKPGISYYVSFKNKDYTFWNGGGWVSEGPITDSIRSTGVVIRKGTGSAGAGEEYIVEELIKDGLFQIEEGSTATAYEPPAPSPDYPVEIHSLNDFDVVSSVGKRNLIALNNMEFGTFNYNTGINSTSNKFKRTINLIPVNPETKYYLWHNLTPKEGSNGIEIAWTFYRMDKTAIRGKNQYGQNTSIITPSNAHFIKIRFGLNQVSWDDDKYLLIKSSNTNSWVLAPEDITESDNHPLIDKINLSLSEPLRSVGDVKDRLFRDSDGLWKVERNIYSETLNAETRLTTANKDYDTDLTSNRWVTPKYRLSGLSAHSITSHFKREESVWFSDRIGHVVNAGNQYHLNFPNRLLGILESDSASVRENKIRNWLQTQYDEGTPVVIKGVLVEPITELLSDEVQDKLNNLRSFQDSNYVYTVLDKTNILSENLKPTLHAKFLYNNWYKEDRVINNLMIYNRALTNEEMLQNYKTIKRRWGM